MASDTYLDEEECLPFPIFIAELELLVGYSNRGKPDGVQLLELLQKLVAIIPRTEKAVLKQHQRQCETMLYDVLAHGIGAAVRRLIYSCLTLLYTYGDSISIYTRVSSLLAYLSSKEGMSRSTAEPIRVGLLDFLALLNTQHGRMLAGSAQESVGIALRTVSKSGNQTAVRCAALRMATAVVHGLSPADRSAPAVHSEAWSIVQRHAKDRTSEEVRAGCLGLLSVLCGAGGGPLWREGAYSAEEALRLCLAMSEDPVQAVRDAACRAMGDLAAASRGSAAAEALAGEKRPAKKAAAERVLAGCVRGCLVTPLVDAAVHGRREACLGFSGAWMAYIASLPRHREGHDHTSDVMEIAALLISAVGEAGRLAAEMRASPEASSELGAGLAAGGELPPLQASALYVLRRGVMASLAEAGQRKLLERLSDTLDKRLVTPAAVVTLEALATLLEAVGEVTDETAVALERLLQPYVTSSSAATRQQATLTLSSLAVAHPAGAARMIEGCLDTVATCARQLAAPLTPASSASTDVLAAASAAANGDAPALATVSQPPTPSPSAGGATPPAAAAAPSLPPTPTAAAAAAATPTAATAASAGNGGASRAPFQRSAMDACHGAALAAARLLLTTAHAPLGCPARLQRRALALAEDLVTGPGPEAAGSRAICREVGFLLLGALCALGVPQATRGPEEMAALWQTALGEAAQRELDERRYSGPGGDLELAVQLWWRSVALQALSAYLAAAQSQSASSARPAGATAGGYRGSSSMPLLQPAFDSGASFSVRSESGPAGGLAGARAGSAGAGLGAGSGSGSGLDFDSADVVAFLVPLVQPLLELLDSQPCLQDPVKARGGPGGVIAGAAATFTLCLLELHLRAPGGRLVPSSTHVGILAKACLRPFRLGLTPAAADALTRCSLRGLLSADDAPLGPWPSGADPHEQALRAYTGGRGAPHLAPWLTAEEHAALLTGGSSAALSAASGGGAGPSPAAASSAAYGNEYEAADGSLSGGMGSVTTSLAGSGRSDSLGGSGSGATGLSLSEAGGLAHATYPQPVGLEAAMLTAQLVVLGRLMAASPVAQQLQMLEIILGAVQSAKSLARQSRDTAACRRLPLGVAAAVAALAGYGPAAMAARRSKAPFDPSDKVPEKLLQLAQAIMPDDSAAAPDAVPLSRAAAELFAASAAAGSDAWALRVVRALGSELESSAAEGRDSQRRGVIALALGAAHRARGGLAMQGAVADSVDALVAAASRPGCSAAAAWVLHALWLVACGGGGAFVPRVKTSLQLAQELLVSSFESPALRAACARLANAAVATLGPEFALGSPAYSRAKSLVVASGGGAADSGSGVAGAVAAHAARPGSAADGGLGMALFVQQIILFAPHAVPPAKHVPLLLAHLVSAQPDLRAASALTLRHLAERSAGVLRPEEAAPPLFAALDAESDARITGQLRATLTTVLVASGSTQPSFWLGLLSDVVFAVGAPAVSASAAGGDADGHRGAEEDDEDKYGQPAAAAASSSTAGKASTAPEGGSAKALREVREVLAAPHLRTRHFAADCLLRLIRVCVASDERHRDATAFERQDISGSARATGGGSGARDLLILKLQVLVDIGFKLATCDLESLKPHGVRMLTLLVRLFGHVPDPLLHGARLMEQYQAQVVSALRSSLGTRQAVTGTLPSFSSQNADGGGLGGSASVSGAAVGAQNPLLRIAGGVLATTFLESGLAAGDAVVMRRLMELLSAPLASWHMLRYEPYAEWVGVRARVELLHAHAQCTAIAASAAARGDALCAGIVTKAHEPHAARLQTLWGLLLQDHTVLSSQPDEVAAAYRSPLLDGAADLPVSPAEAAAAAGERATAPGGAREGDEGPLPAEVVSCGGSDAGAAGAGGAGLTSALAAVVRPAYSAACPAVLAALAGSLPPATHVAADAAARVQFRRLLEVGVMLLTDASARLAHAVHAAIAGAGSGARAHAGAAGANGGSAPEHGQTADAAEDKFAHVREAANRLAGVLCALQRLLAAPYIGATVIVGPDTDTATSSVADGASQPPNGHAAERVATAATEHQQQLVPPAVLHDVLCVLGATAAHALLPLQWAALSGVVPPGIGGLVPALALPCCAVVRELCGAAPEECLGAAPDSDASWHAGEEDDAVLRRRQSSLSAGPRNAADGESPRGHGTEEKVVADAPSAGPGSIVAAGVESILLLASVCSPYSCGSSAGRNGRPEASPVWLQPACAPLPSSAAAEPTASLAQCTVQALAAAQLLLRRAPWPSLEPHIGALLQLPLRLMLTSQPGAPVTAAAQRFLENAIATLSARAQQPAPPSAAAPGPVATADNALAYASAALVALADAVARHLQMLSEACQSDDSGAQVSGPSGSASALLLLQGRFSALVAALISSCAALPAEQQPSAAASPSRTSSGRSRATSSGSGSGAGLLTPPQQRSSLRGGPGGASRSPSLSSVAAASPVANAGRADYDATAGPSAASARGCTLSVLVSALRQGVPTAAALVVCEAVRGFVAGAAGEDAASARGRWARSLVGAVTPVMVERAHTLLAPAKQPLAGEEQSLVAECLKILVLAPTLSAPHGAVAQEGVMQVLVPLLIDVAAPAAGGAAATPPLRDMAIKLITSLPASATGGAFKAQLAAQPAAAKLRLQGALREAAAAAAAGSVAAVAAPSSGAAGAAQQQQQQGAVASPTAAGPAPGSSRRPAIQLKTTFALPLPGK